MVICSVLKLYQINVEEGTHECAFLSIHNKTCVKVKWTVFSGPFPKFNSPMH